ncbi:MAG TPA: ATP-binding protein, partial [Psychromonas sp.]
YRPRSLDITLIDNVPLSTALQNKISNSRRYLSREIKSLSFSGDLNKSPTSLRFNAAGQVGKNYLSLTKTLKNVDWQVRVLTPTTSLLINITMLILFLSLFYLLIYLVHVLISQKQSRHKEQVLLQAKAKQQLEFQVMQRTSALRAEIDERRKAERALRETQKELIQSAKLAVLGQLSASISHELNNPLAAIRSYAENAITFLNLDKNDKVSNNLTRITYLTDRMAKISSQLKAFARKSDGELSLISLQPVLLAAHELVKPQLKASQVLLEMDLPDKPVQVKAEPIQLEQIVVNLLSNAIQAMEECEEKQIKITLSVQDNQAQVEVIDIGIGIKQSDLTLLFEPFFTTKETGLGLGLSISQQIITNMHGKIWAKNRQNQGAKFCISLPLQH